MPGRSSHRTTRAISLNLWWVEVLEKTGIRLQDIERLPGIDFSSTHLASLNVILELLEKESIWSWSWSWSWSWHTRGRCPSRASDKLAANIDDHAIFLALLPLLSAYYARRRDASSSCPNFNFIGGSRLSSGGYRCLDDLMAAFVYCYAHHSVRIMWTEITARYDVVLLWCLKTRQRRREFNIPFSDSLRLLDAHHLDERRVPAASSPQSRSSVNRRFLPVQNLRFQCITFRRSLRFDFAYLEQAEDDKKHIKSQRGGFYPATVLKIVDEKGGQEERGLLTDRGMPHQPGPVDEAHPARPHTLYHMDPQGIHLIKHLQRRPSLGSLMGSIHHRGNKWNEKRLSVSKTHTGAGSVLKNSGHPDDLADVDWMSVGRQGKAIAGLEAGILSIFEDAVTNRDKQEH
ncbi:hypothetical protein SISNIDRAFT_470492 [Sistotremastrum niveocremeum HHB9708]|uniref:Uncharacterized protein n=1 Tax=Sistotremastrum niveocremeum HHB9708 TaxID=1314777 RepID=A0A164NTF2_9AGAM|nr:hypothetical protein SISNIDRAFT_470492 [Sistotremastrum niveocremeum HHB9708]